MKNIIKELFVDKEKYVLDLISKYGLDVSGNLQCTKNGKPVCPVYPVCPTGRRQVDRQAR